MSVSKELKNILNLYHNNPSEVIFEISNKFFNNFCSETIDLDNDKKLMKFYMDKRNFKYPNNFWVFSDFMWGKEYRKILKKNELRIVDTFMQMWGVKGKKLKKYLHETEQVNIQTYLFAKDLFGEDWMNQDGDLIKKILNGTHKFNLPENLKENLSHEELRRVYSVFKQTMSSDYFNSWSFQDHMNIFSKLKS